MTRTLQTAGLLAGEPVRARERRAAGARTARAGRAGLGAVELAVTVGCAALVAALSVVLVLTTAG